MFSKSFWQDEIGRMGLPEMPIKLVEKKHENPIYCDAKTYYELIKTFLKDIGFSEEGIKSLWGISLTREGIIKIRNEELPENLDVIFKTPLQYGGAVDTDNLLLIQTHPFANKLFDFKRKQCKKYHDKQIKKQTLYGYETPPKMFVPDIKNPVFVPAMMGWSSPAGNGSTDVFTQSSSNQGGRE